MIPQNAALVFKAETDAGECSICFPSSGGEKNEYELPLGGAGEITSISIEIRTDSSGIAAGWFNWIGLANKELVAAHVAQWDRFDSAWVGYLKPESFEPTFLPQAQLLMSVADMERLRRVHGDHIARFGTSPILEAAKTASTMEPEKMIGEFVNFWTDTRYNRVRYHGKLLIDHGVAAATGGILSKDKELQRLAARYGMGIASCDVWDTGFQSRFRDGPFEHRAFTPSLCLHDLAIILDLAGEWFTDTGRDLILRRMAEVGLGTINFNTWKHEYIFHCNQLAWFTPGRILASVLLEKHWPRAARQTDIGIEDLTESMAYAILPDGGYPEGPTYFQCVSKDALLPYHVYAHARGLRMRDIVPESILKTGAFAEMIASTDDSSDCIPICDARPEMNQTGLALISHLMPDSQWVRIYRKKLERENGIPDTMLAMQKDLDISGEAPPLNAFVQLPEMGPVASVRSIDGHLVKLFIQGNKANAGHAHEDKGSFVLEFAGDTFAMDPGTCDYSHPNSGLLKHCERHNMLIPTGIPQRPAPTNPLPVDVKPVAEGDKKSFKVEIDLSPGWEGLYRKWSRRFWSPEPNVLTITDDYELERGDGVAFLFNTPLDVEIRNGTVEIFGRKGMARVTVSEQCETVVETLPIDNSREQRRIAFHKQGKAGGIGVKIELRTR